MDEDRVLVEMAAELKLIVIDEGLDPANIPTQRLVWNVTTHTPTEEDSEATTTASNNALDEYKRRGGTAITDETALNDALVKEVERMCNASG